MIAAMSALEAAFNEALRLEAMLKKGRPRLQVTLTDERSASKATALAWFSNYKGLVVAALNEDETKLVDRAYKAILESSARAGARTKYLSLLKEIKRSLINLQSTCAVLPPTQVETVDKVPNFTPLISDQAMQAILVARWDECIRCLEAEVSLAATVMMGGLEALLLARINRETDKKAIFTARGAPQNYLKKVKPLPEWMLKDFIDVVHELGWISVSAKDVGAVLRDYRNYIHPQKQLTHGVHLKSEDARLFWEVSKSIARQVIDSAKKS
jgi:hypothetical protein